MLVDEVPVLKGSNVGELLVDGSAWGLFADASGNFDLGTLTGVSFTPDVADASNTSIERFFGVLTEHYAGAFPAWLAPVQVLGVPVADEFNDHLADVASPPNISPNRTTNPA